jgi:hypothetical protein
VSLRGTISGLRKVLESLVKRGLPSPAEETDAAMSCASLAWQKWLGSSGELHWECFLVLPARNSRRLQGSTKKVLEQSPIIINRMARGDKKTSITPSPFAVFLCTWNASRSIFAEYFMKDMGSSRFVEAFSGWCDAERSGVSRERP